MSEFRVHIQEPCHENWDKMTRTEQGKFCSFCEKEVMDFSNYSKEKLNQSLKEIHDQRTEICGRFDAKQLSDSSINMVEIDYHKLTFQQLFIMSIVVVFFLGGLASCKVTDKTIGVTIIDKKASKVGQHLNNLENLCCSSDLILGPIVVKDSVKTPSIDIPIDTPLDTLEVIGELIIQPVKKIKNVYFPNDVYKLDKKAKDTLDQLCLDLDKNYEYQIELIGHTDSNGSSLYNKDLSDKRANEVKKYLEKKGIKVEITRGVGYQFPVANNTSMVGRAANRRVEIILKKGEKLPSN